MKLKEDGSDMLTLFFFFFFSYETGGTVLDSLKTIDLIRCDTGLG